jgi:sodium/proline symporter
MCRQAPEFIGLLNPSILKCLGYILVLQSSQQGGFMLHSAYLWDLIIYFTIIYIISYFASRATHDEKDFILAGRGLNSWIVALGAGASDMSGWLLMGLPGAVVLNGLSEIWMPIGLLCGAYLNWTLVAKRLRVRSEELNDASTIPAFIENAFHHSRMIILITSVILIFFFAIYASAGFVSGALLFKTVFNIPYNYSLLLTFSTIILYTFIGGFIAVSWVDFFQGSLMLFALLIVPIVAWHALSLRGGHEVVMSGYLQPFHGMGIIGILSLLGWGLGYFGQPHILIRFMAIKDPEKLKQSKRTAMSWMFLCLIGAVLCGVIGAYYYGQAGLSNPESVFLSLSKELFHPVFGGILFSAVLSVVMSSVAAQLLIASSAIAQDILGKYVFKSFSHKKLLWLNRFALLGIGIFSMLMASSPDSTILNLVSYAWAGLGASFGPLILLLVYKKPVSEVGAIMGILTGALTVFLWKHLAGFGALFALYEIIPAFILSFIAILIFSRFNKKSIRLS